MAVEQDERSTKLAVSMRHQNTSMSKILPKTGFGHLPLQPIEEVKLEEKKEKMMDAIQQIQQEER